MPLVISIHAPRAGGDELDVIAEMEPELFQSTPPVRGATGKPTIKTYDLVISIHAPRAGGDHALVLQLDLVPQISIHAPRAGGDTAPC